MLIRAAMSTSALPTLTEAQATLLRKLVAALPVLESVLATVVATSGVSDPGDTR